jgi:hypothetical protein
MYCNFYLLREIIGRWDNGTLTVGKEGESDPFLSYVDPEPFGIGYFGVCTGWGATGDWLIEGKYQNFPSSHLQAS